MSLRSSSIVRSLALVRSCLGLIQPHSAHIPSFRISNYFAIILVSASSACFTLAVSMREVSFVVYTPRAWDPRSLQSMLNSPLYFGLLQRLRSDLRTALSLEYNNNNNNDTI